MANAQNKWVCKKTEDMNIPCNFFCCWTSDLINRIIIYHLIFSRNHNKRGKIHDITTTKNALHNLNLTYKTEVLRTWLLRKLWLQRMFVKQCTYTYNNISLNLEKMSMVQVHWCRMWVVESPANSNIFLWSISILILDMYDRM